MRSIDDGIDFLLEKKDLFNPKNLEELGYIFFGPLVFNYIIWLSKEVKDGDVVLFNSREGFFLKEIYDSLKEDFNLPPSVYFKTSRRLSLLSFLESQDDIYDSFKLHRYKGTLSDLLEYRFGIINSNENYDIDTIDVLPNLNDYVSDILEKAKETKQYYKEYINEIIKDNKNVFMVDSGFQGSTQFYLQKAFNLNLKGRYMTYKGNINLEDTYGFYDFNKCSFKDNIIFFESVFTDCVGSYVDINSKGFVNELNSNNQKVFKSKIKIVNGIKKFVKEMISLNCDLSTTTTIKSDNIFNLMCVKNTIKNEKLFDTFFHDNLYTRNIVKKLIRF